MGCQLACSTHPVFAFLRVGDTMRLSLEQQCMIQLRLQAVLNLVALIRKELDFIERDIENEKNSNFDTFLIDLNSNIFG
jgi:hypothetical protein